MISLEVHNVGDLEVHHVGDDHAFDVRLCRCNGGDYPPWITFEVAKVPSGGSFAAKFWCSPET